MSQAELMAVIGKLSLDERAELIARIEESMEQELAVEPMPEWQKAELERRRREYLENPDSYLTWEEARRLIRDQHGL